MDTESQLSGDNLGLMEDLANPQCLDRDLFLSTDSNTSHSSDDEDDGDQDDEPGDQDEDSSLPRYQIVRELLKWDPQGHLV